MGGDPAGGGDKGPRLRGALSRAEAAGARRSSRARPGLPSSLGECRPWRHAHRGRSPAGVAAPSPHLAQPGPRSEDRAGNSAATATAAASAAAADPSTGPLPPRGAARAAGAATFIGAVPELPRPSTPVSALLREERKRSFQGRRGSLRARRRMQNTAAHSRLRGGA